MCIFAAFLVLYLIIINIERQRRYVIEGDIWAIDEGGTATRGVGGLVGAGACVAGLCGCGGIDSDTDYGVW